MGAPHGAEVGAVWYRTGMDPADQPKRQRIADAEFAGLVHAVWCTFIAGPQAGIDWPPFSEAEAAVLRIADGRVWADKDPFAARLQLWHMP